MLRIFRGRHDFRLARHHAVSAATGRTEYTAVVDQHPIKLQDLSDTTQRAIFWLAGRFRQVGHWPSMKETVLFCRRERVLFDNLLREDHRPVEEISRNNESEILLAPWALYDSDGYFASLYNAAHSRLLQTLDRLTETSGDPIKLTWTEIASAAGVSESDVVREQIRWLLERSRLGARSDGPDGVHAEVGIYYLRGPTPVLDEFFLSRPKRYASEGSSGEGPASPRHRYRSHSQLSLKPTPWVFLASTWEDLREHRQKVRDAIAKAKCLPLGMEAWSADTRPPIECSLEEVAQADLMVVVVGCRYGSLVELSGCSFTETEYDAAKSRRIGVLAFLPTEGTPWDPRLIDHENAGKLDAFKSRLRKEGQHISTYSDLSNLQFAVHAALVEWKARLQTVASDTNTVMENLIF